MKELDAFVAMRKAIESLEATLRMYEHRKAYDAAMAALEARYGR